MLRTSKPALVAIYGILGIWTLVTLFPIYWTLITSVKTPDAVYRSVPAFIPFVDYQPSLQPFARALFGGARLKVYDIGLQNGAPATSNLAGGETGLCGPELFTVGEAQRPAGALADQQRLAVVDAGQVEVVVAVGVPQ